MNPKLMAGRRQTTSHPFYRYLLSALLIIPITLLLWWLRGVLTIANFSLIYILAILIIAVWLGIGPSLLAAIASFFGFNFFLIRPYYTLTVEDPRELLDLFIFLLVAVIASQVAAYARRQAAAARLRAAEQQLLYDLSSAFNRLTEREEVLRELDRVLREALAVEAVTLLPETDEPPTRHSPATSYLLLAAGENVHGTLRVTFSNPPSAAQSRLLMACSIQTAMALQRIELAGRAQRSRALEEADRLKTALLRAVSHDLRTPLTIIKTSAGNLQTLADNLSREKRLEMAYLIESEADHLDKLVGNLLDMSRLQAGALVLHQDWHALAEIAGDVAARAWQLYEDERVRLAFPDEMPLVYCDYTLMVRALTNIVENALRYEPADSLVVIRGEVVHENGKQREGRVAIVNHGPSIPDGEKDFIMAPFYQGHTSAARDGGNREGHVGLGLAIARGIIEAHRGRIWVEDTPGGGATVVVALPLDEKEIADDVDSRR